MASKDCKKCHVGKTTLDFPRSHAIWLDGTSDICFQCLEDMYNPQDLNSVDKVMQYLDIQFDPNDWMEIYQLSGPTAIQTYTTKHYARRNNTAIDWQESTNAWKKKREEGKLNREIKVLNQDWVEKMKKRWGNYSVEQYDVLEAFYENIQHTQNVTTAIQRDQAENICRLSLVIRKKIQSGEDASKEIKAYNDYIKSAGFQPKNARNYGDFESIGELINFLVKKGYKPKFYQQQPQQRDLVDLTIKNNQSYLRRLVNNQPGLSDMVQQRKNSYKVAQQLQDEGMDDLSMEKYDSTTAKIEYEDSGLQFQEALNGQ